MLPVDLADLLQLRRHASAGMVKRPFQEFSVQPVERFINGIDDVEQIRIDQINRAEFDHRFKLRDLSPIVTAKQKNGQLVANFTRLYQGNDFHEFVQCAKSTWHDRHRIGHIDQQNLRMKK